MLGKLWRKITLLFSRQRFHSELDEEMAFHRAQMEAELIENGVSRDEARYAAKRRFGNTTRLKEQSHDAIGFRFETVLQDLRYAWRQLCHSPGFAFSAVFILALGMGVSVAIFGFVDAALIQPLPYALPNRLLDVAESATALPRSNLSRADYEDWKRMNTTLSSLDVYSGQGYLLRMGSVTEPVPAARVSDGFFRTLGVKPMLGRDFLPGEDLPGKAKIVILPYSTWQQRFGSRTNVIGQAVSLSGDTYTIVGVLPREFNFAPRGNAEFWVPLLDKSSGCEQRRSCHNLFGIGRLRDGVTIHAATADLKRVAKQLEALYPGSNKDQGAAVQPLTELIVGQVRPILLMLLAGTGLLLMIACVNVASLMLVRSESRRREIAVRGALGATSVRLARQFITEGLLLATAGSAGGLLLGGWLMRLMALMIPKAMRSYVPFLGAVAINTHVVLFAAAIIVLAALVLAATPVLRLAGMNLPVALGEGGRGSAGRFWQRLGANLVVAEITIAVVLLAGAGLIGRSFYNLLHVESGFDTTHLATMQVMAPDSIYKTNPQVVALYREINRRIMALPGVQSVGFTTDLPVQCNCDTDWIRIEGKPFHGEHNEVNERDISPDYLATLKASLVQGRMLNAQDDLAHPQVVVINQTLAKKYFPGEDPVGKRIGQGDLAPDSMRQIVGVIADVREGGLDDDVWPTEYEPIYRATDTQFAIAVRTAIDDKAIIPSIVATLHSIDSNLGVRMALGAQRSAVYSLVLRQAGWLTVAGLAIGLACSIGASELMGKLLFGVAAWDPATLASVALLLGSASLLASFLPARRAASVNPSDALRAE